LHFTINYLLEEIPPPPPPPPPVGGGGGMPVVKRCYLDIDMLGEITTLSITCCTNKVRKTYVATDPDEIHFLEIEQDTQVICGCTPGCYDYPEIIVMRPAVDPPPVPEGMTFVGPVYSWIGYECKDWQDPDCPVCPIVTFGAPVMVLLDYDAAELDGAHSPLMYYYDNDCDGLVDCADPDIPEVEGCWVLTQRDEGRPAEVGVADGLVNHFSLLGILATLPPPPPPPPTPAPPPPPPPPPPAHFVASDLTIVPSWEKIEWGALIFVVSAGRSVTVTTNVGNDGGQAGSYVANLKINGQTWGTKEITLSPGQSQGIDFSVLDNEPGHYIVEVGGLSGEFQTSVWVNWWLIAGLTAAFILLVWVAWYYGYYRKRHLK